MGDFLVSNLRHLASLPEAPGQVAAGKSAGVGQPAVSKIVMGRTKEPSFRTVLGLARHYGVSLDDLAERDLVREGPSPKSQAGRLDAGKLASLIEAVDSAIAESKKRVPPRARARWIAALYAEETGAAPDAKGAVDAVLAALLATWEEA